MRVMIDLARLVGEGALPGSDDQRANALRLLGIGLFLDGRPDGAERAFLELLRLRPKAGLDPATRPDVITFFKDVRRRSQPPKYRALAFVPPLGQFQNATPRRGWVIGGLEALTLTTAITSRVLLGRWRQGDETCGRANPSDCDRMRLVNQVAVGALVATFVYGVVDALVNFEGNDSDALEEKASTSFTLLPTGAGLRLSF